MRAIRISFPLLTLLLLEPLLIRQTQDNASLGGQKSSQSKSQTEEKMASHFERAQKLAQAQRYSEAISEYRLALQEDPENESVHFGLAFAQSQAGQNSEAIQSYQAALKINPKLWEAEINLGILRLKQENFPEALSRFRKAQKLNPKNFRTNYYTGKAQELLGNLSDAEVNYLLALERAQADPDKFDVHASLGSLYLRKKSLAKAEKHFLAARQYQGEVAAVDLDLAQLYYETGQREKALELLHTLTTNQPEDPEVHELMGRLFSEKKDYEAAIRSLELAIKYQPNPERQQSLSLEIAQAYQQLDRTEEAIHYLKGVSKTSADPKFHLNLGSLYLQKRDFESAKQEFLRALELNSDCTECYSNLGSVFLLQEKYAEAIAALTRFKDFKPENAGAYFYLGIAYDKLNDYQNAWLHYQKFLNLDHGKMDKQEFQARERMKVLEKKIKKR